MPLKANTVEAPVVNLTPMIDVVFLLLIFFMVAAKFTNLERRIDLSVPRVAQAAAMTPAPAKRMVNIYADGRILLDGDPVDLAGLTTRLLALQAQYDDAPVLIRGEANASHQRVTEVLAACRAAGLSQPSLAVQPLRD